jgi:hypothetical protein
LRVGWLLENTFKPLHTMEGNLLKRISGHG